MNEAKIADADQAAALKQYWSERLEALKALIANIRER